MEKYVTVERKLQRALNPINISFSYFGNMPKTGILRESVERQAATPSLSAIRKKQITLKAMPRGNHIIYVITLMVACRLHELL